MHLDEGDLPGRLHDGVAERHLIAQAEVLEREVDEIVCWTYGLSKNEIAEIERWHEERRAMLSSKDRRRDNGAGKADNASSEEADAAVEQEAGQ